ncbi:Secretory lipase [Metschnikowia aff. pulcherrima]|uniref:Secretory lipase n=1 Tax=Metschnikowia aff. pulcherrima TaxID=2163413 RepID=A0A4P6XP74_9ASCO|nr:Secretory lipase [Metschnikowia aff. pulcherrima]
MRSLTLLLSFCFLLNLGLALFGRSFQPSKDEFYKNPANIDSYKEGEIMKWRDTPRRIRSFFVPSFRAERAWQFMVKSTNTRGEPVGIVGTLIEPKNADTSKLVAYNHFTDSACVDCASSYSLLLGAGVSTISTQIEFVAITQALRMGWYVVIADYQGQKAGFGASILNGHAVLDTIRGALKSEDKSGLKPDARVGIWGYSGGTIPLAWAGALQPKYAPELSKNLVGVAVGGWATNLTSVLQNVDGTVQAGLIGAGILGLMSEYPEVEKTLFDHVKKSLVRSLKSLYNKCVIITSLTFLKSKFFKGRSPIFTEGEDFLRRPEIKTILDENTLAVDNTIQVPEVPFFVHHGEPDDLVPFADAQRVYDMWCSQGIKSMEFAVSETSDHTFEYIEGLGAVVSWLTNVLNGKAPVDGCERTVRRTNLLYPGADTQSIRETRGTLEGAVKKVKLSLGTGNEKTAESSLETSLKEEAKAVPQEDRIEEEELESPEASADKVIEEPTESEESTESEEQGSEKESVNQTPL